MTNTRRLITRTAAILIAGTILGTGAHLTAAPSFINPDAVLDASQVQDMRNPHDDRYLVAEDTTDDHSDPDPVADCLTAQGYMGDPDDGEEAIYAGRTAIEACAAASK